MITLMQVQSILGGTDAVPNPSSIWHLADRHVKPVLRYLIDNGAYNIILVKLQDTVGVRGGLTASQGRTEKELADVAYLTYRL